MGNCQNFCSLVFPGDSGIELERQLLMRSNSAQMQLQQQHRRPRDKNKRNNSKGVVVIDGQQQQTHQLQLQHKEDMLESASSSSISLDEQLRKTDMESQVQQSSRISPAVAAANARTFVRIKTSLWKKDSHMLFDYENTDVTECIFKLKSSGSLVIASSSNSNTNNNNNERVSFIKKLKNNNNTNTNQEQPHSQQNQKAELFKLEMHPSSGKWYLHQNLPSDDNAGVNDDAIANDSSDDELKPHPQSNWIVVKSVQTHRPKGFRVVDGDFIKLGRLKLRVREICHQGQQVQTQIKRIIEENTEVASEHEATEMLTIRSARNIDDPLIHPVHTSCISGASISSPSARKSQLSTQPQLQQQQQQQQQYSQSQYVKKFVGDSSQTPQMCKICLNEDDDDAKNPLVNPCKCTGSMKYVHLKCIQQWVHSKIQSSHQKDGCLVLLTKHFECELCKQKYRLKVEAKGQVYDIIDYTKPEDGSASLILEAYTGTRFQLYGIFILRLNARSDFTIGRSQEADVRVSDISVSRLHATFSYDAENKALFIKDKDSKFGTLVLMRGNLEITPYVNQIQIQNGRAIAQVLVGDDPAQSSGIFASCFSPAQISSHIELYSEPEEHDNEVDRHAPRR